MQAVARWEAIKADYGQHAAHHIGELADAYLAEKGQEDTGKHLAMLGWMLGQHDGRYNDAMKNQSNHTVYRVASSHKIPTHWAYGSPWELSEPHLDDKPIHWQDAREKGAQVWDDLRSVVSATFWHNDGEYGPQAGYSHLLEIGTPKVHHSEPWNVIHKADSVRSVDLRRLHSWLSDNGADKDNIEEWMESGGHDKIKQWIDQNATDHPVEFEDTLPPPKHVTHIDAKGKKRKVRYPTEYEIGDTKPDYAPTGHPDDDYFSDLAASFTKPPKK